MGYTPPYEVTDRILELVSSITEKAGRISRFGELESKPHLRRNNKIRSVHSSLSIEANSLSLEAVLDVLDGKRVLGPAKEIQEVKNAFDAYNLIGEINPYNINDLKSVHGVMTKYIIDESGNFRRGAEGVFSGDTCIFMAPPAWLVPTLMDDLFAWMNNARGTVHPLIIAAVFHYEFVFIHPFSDGNGRMARLWHTAILSKWKSVFEYIPLESQIELYQDEYYKAISACHVAGKSTQFITFMLEQIDRTIDEILSCSDYEEDISDYEKKLVGVMEFGRSYSATAILELLGLKSKDSLRKNYIDPAINHGLIEMTLPDKPKSKNQKYIRK